jgi:hypothetical protein
MRDRKRKEKTMTTIPAISSPLTTVSGLERALLPSPTVMTEEELIQFLRIPEISNATNYRHVVENLKRKHGLPRIHLCGRTVYLTDSVKVWLEKHVVCGR